MEKYKRDKFNGILLPTVTSTGASAEEWISILKENYKFGSIGSSAGNDLSKQILQEKKFKESVTKGITYQPVVVRSKRTRNTSLIKKKYLERGYRLPPMELFPLLLNTSWFTDFLYDQYLIEKFYLAVCMHEGTELNGPRIFTRHPHLLSVRGIKEIYGIGEGLLLPDDYLYIFIK